MIFEQRLVCTVGLPRPAPLLPTLIIVAALAGWAGPAAAQNSYSVRVVGSGDVQEDSTPSIEFRITKSGDRSGSVGYQTESGTAINTNQSQNCGSGNGSLADDYGFQADRVRFNRNESEKSVFISVCDDRLHEDDETFVLRILDPNGRGTIATETATVTIRNDDNPPRVSVGAFNVTEGDTGSQTVDIKFSLDSESGKPASFDYSIQQIPESPQSRPATVGAKCDGGVDIAARSSGRITIDAGDTEATIKVQVCGDTEIEPAGESFGLTLSSPVNATLSSPSNLLTIADNDVYPRPTLSNINPVSIQRNVPVPAGTSLTENIQLQGAAFLPESVVRLDGKSISKSLRSGTRIDATVSLVGLSAGIHKVTVENPAPGGGSSAVQTFTIKDVNLSSLVKPKAGTAELDEAAKTAAKIGIAQIAPTVTKLQFDGVFVAGTAFRPPVLETDATVVPVINFTSKANQYRLSNCSSLTSASWSALPAGASGEARLARLPQSILQPGFLDLCVQVRSVASGGAELVSNSLAAQIQVVRRIVHTADQASVLETAQNQGFKNTAQALTSGFKCSFGKGGFSVISNKFELIASKGDCRFRIFQGKQLAELWTVEEIRILFPSTYSVSVETSASGRSAAMTFVLKMLQGIDPKSIPIQPGIRVRLRGPDDGKWQDAFAQ
jgi:hypothetical protein